MSSPHPSDIHGPRNGEAWSIAAACRAESVEPHDVAKTGRRWEVQKHGENQGKPQDFMVKKHVSYKNLNTDLKESRTQDLMV
jgi:hypothetical protein